MRMTRPNFLPISVGGRSCEPAFGGTYLRCDRLPTPFFGSHICHCLREGPVVAFKVLDGVLALTERHISWLCKNPRPD